MDHIHFDPETFAADAHRLRSASLEAVLEKAGDDARQRQLILQQDRLFEPKVAAISAMLSMRNSGVEDEVILAAVAEFCASIATMAVKTSPNASLSTLHRIMNMTAYSAGQHLLTPGDSATSVEIHRERGGRA